MPLRWNTPQYPRICPSTTTHCTHSAHENGLHHQAPLRCLPGPDQTKGPLRERDVPPPRRRPSLGPPGGDPGRSGAGAEQVVRFPPPDLWRPHRPSYNRYVRGRETAASQQGRHAHDAQARSGQGEDRAPRSAEADRLRQDARRARRGSGDSRDRYRRDQDDHHPCGGRARARHLSGTRRSGARRAQASRPDRQGHRAGSSPHHGRVEPPVPLLRRQRTPDLADDTAS